jgi:glycosyltransferase involved in cell wall biosynthesis
MNNNKQIISFYYKHKPGGFTTRLYKAWLGLANTGYQVTYISTEKLPVDHEAINVQLINCKSRQGTSLFWLEYFIRAIFEARKLAKSGDVYCFFVFQFFYSTLAILSALGSNVKTLVFVRGDDVHDASFKSLSSVRMAMHRFLENFSVKHSSIVVATNKDMMNTLKARATSTSAKFDFLPNNIVNADVQYTQPKFSEEDGVFRFVTTSVLNERKNLLYALKALKEVKSTNWEYLIIGADVENTGYGKKMEEFIQQHGFQDKIKMLGWSDDAAALVSRCDLFILPTTMEGSPNALLEALGTHISCIGSDIPEVTELLDAAEMSFDLAKPESLASSLEAYCNDQSYREKLASHSLKSRERYVFDWEKRIVDYVEQVVAESTDSNTLISDQQSLNID